MSAFRDGVLLDRGRHPVLGVSQHLRDDRIRELRIVDVAIELTRNHRRRQRRLQGIEEHRAQRRVVQVAFRAYFSPSWTAFQTDGGRDFNVIVDGVSV